MKVLVVGAGPTGLTAGIELARLGLKPSIIDRRSGASQLSRAVGITPRSLELLSRSGVADSLIKEGIAMDGLRVYSGQKLLLGMTIQSERAFHPNLVCLPQDRTEAIMGNALAGLGAKVEFGVQLKSIAKTNNGVVAKFDHGGEKYFDHVIGADGIRSTVRKALGVSYPGFDLEEKWSIADVELADWRHPNCLTVVQSGPGIVSVVVPIGETRYRVVASREKALDAISLPLDITRVRREGTFTISVRSAENYSDGRVHLAGDAAHCHSPVGGRGMNLGIADAADLARRIIEGQIDGYSSTRSEEAKSARKFTERGRKFAVGSSFARRVAFRTLVGTAKLLPPVRGRLSRFIVEF